MYYVGFNISITFLKVQRNNFLYSCCGDDMNVSKIALPYIGHTGSPFLGGPVEPCPQYFRIFC